MNWALPIRLLLWPVSVSYGAWMAVRARLYRRGLLRREWLRKPVICVGNLTVGGTGKTPMVIWLAERFAVAGQRVTILTRGYGGDGSVSDEVSLMRRRLGASVQFGVGPDRAAEGRRLEAQTDVFLLDDGFQHLRLGRDADVLLLDATRPLHTESMLPAGRLRERQSAAARADVIVRTRAELAAAPSDSRFHVPEFHAASALRGWREAFSGSDGAGAGPARDNPVFAFCGIGNPGAFFADLEQWGIRTAGRRYFRDHHKYSAEEIAALQAAAQQVGAAALVTTEKDLENLPGDARGPLPVFAAVIALEVSDEAGLMQAVTRCLERSGGVRR